MFENAFRSAILLSMSLVGALAALATNFILARHMPAADMGYALTIISTATLFSVVPFLGLDAAIIKYVRRYSAKNRPQDCAHYLRFLKRVFWVNCAILSMASLALLHWYSGQGKWHQFLPWLPAIAAIPIFAWMRFRSQLAYADGHVIGAAVGRSLIRRLVLLFAVVGLLAAQLPLTALAIAIGFLCAILSAAIVQTLVLPRQIYPEATSEPKQTERKEWFKDGFSLGINLLYLEYVIEIAIVVAALVLKREDLAILAIALRLAGFCRFATVVTDQSFRPQIARAIADGRTAEAKNLSTRAAKLRLLFAAMTMVILLALLPHLPTIIGERYATVPLLVLILVIDVVAFAVLGSPQTVLAQSEYTSILLPISVGSIASLVGAIVIAGLVGNIWAVAWSITFVTTLRKMLLHALTLKLTGFDCSAFQIFERKYADAR